MEIKSYRMNTKNKIKYVFLFMIVIGIILLSQEVDAGLNNYTRDYWSFDTNYSDLITGLSNVSSSGNVRLVSGKVGNALNLTDGAYINYDYNAWVSGNVNYTINFWVKKTVSTQQGNFMSFTSNGALANPYMLFYRQVANTLYNYIFDGTDNTTPLSPTMTGLDSQQWTMVTISRNNTNLTAYENGIVVQSVISTAYLDAGSYNLYFGRDNAGLTRALNGSLDEIGFFNKTLSMNEVNYLYNSGNGRSYPFSNNLININLNLPLNATLISNYVNFSYSVTSSDAILKNVSLFIDDVFNDSRALAGYEDTNTFNKSVPYGSHTWKIQACDVNNDCIFSTETRSFTSAGFTYNSETYTGNVSETSTQTFVINTTGTGTTGTFYYNGTAYTGTRTTSGPDTIFTASLAIPIVIATVNKNFYWDIDGTITPTKVQTVSPIILGQCNSTMNQPYINFTFKDESTSLAMNGSIDLATFVYSLTSSGPFKTLTYINNSEYLNYSFCFTPPDKTIYVNYSVKYSSTNYPQRTIAPSSQFALTNTTRYNNTLYLLSSTDGVYMTIQVFNQNGNPIIGALVELTRTLGTSTITIGEAFTDSAGAATFWVSPLFPISLSVTASGCTSLTNQVISSGLTSYSASLTCQVSNVSSPYTAFMQGIKYQRGPLTGIVQPGLKNFTYFVYTTQNNINASMFLLYYLNGTLAASNLSYSNTSYCLPSSCNLTISNIYFGQGTNVYGRYYVDIGYGLILVEGKATWLSINNTIQQNTLFKALRDFKDIFSAWQYPGTSAIEMEHKIAYSRIVFIFILGAILLTMFGAMTGYDAQNPGSFLIFFIIMVWIMSFADGVSGEGFFYFKDLIPENGTFLLNDVAHTINNYFFGMILILYGTGYYFLVQRRFT